MEQQEFIKTLEEMNEYVDKLISFFDDLSIGRNHCLVEAKFLINQYVNDIFARNTSEEQSKDDLLIKFEGLKKGKII